MKTHECPAVIFEQFAEFEVAYEGTTSTINEQACIVVVFATGDEQYHTVLTVINYSHSRNPPCAPARTHGQIQAPREPPN
jgi:hypothetical protein